MDNYCGEVESVLVRTRTGSGFVLEVLGYGEDFVYRWERLGL